MNNLYDALCDAEEGLSGFITLSGGHLFPVEENVVAGGSILVRQAQKDLWEIFSNVVKSDYSKGMLILGPAGIGKSWAAMFFLVRLVKNRQTVVFESAGQKLVWVFSSTGSRIIKGPAEKINCPELQSTTTTHIFDGKAGANSYEPAQSAAKLALFSSTNRTSYAQSERRVDFIAFYPSTTPDEFRRYVEMMNIDADKAKEISEVFGTGKVRPLTQSLALSKELLASAIERLDLSKLKQYFTTRPPTYGSGNSLDNPAMLFNADLDMTQHGPTKSLYDLYTFGNAKWSWVSKSVTTTIFESNIGRIEPLLRSFYQSVGKVNAKKSLGVLMGQLLEHFAAKLIIENGLEIKELQEGGVSDTTTVISKGLVLQHRQSASIEEILQTCINPEELYVFGNNNAGFDFFNPPNNFFEVTNTLTDSGSHPLLYSALATCCSQVNSQDVNLILVVEKSQEEKWEKPLAYKIDNENVVLDINIFEPPKKSPFKLNGIRSFGALPPSVQAALRKVKQYRGTIEVGQKRNFNSSTVAAQYHHIGSYKFNMVKEIRVSTLFTIVRKFNMVLR